MGTGTGISGDITRKEDGFHGINQMIKHHNGLTKLGMHTCSVFTVSLIKGVVANGGTTDSVSRAEITLDTRGSFNR